MIPRLSSSSAASVIVIVAVLLPNSVHSFFHNQENIIAPINNAGLLINQLLLNTANVSSLLDQNLDHIKRQEDIYPSIEERSDYYDDDDHQQHLDGGEDFHLGSDSSVRVRDL